MGVREEILRDNPYGYWPNDDRYGPGSTSWRDASNNGRTGTVAGSPSVERGLRGLAGRGALRLDTGDYTYGNGVFNQATFTVEGWIFPIAWPSSNQSSLIGCFEGVDASLHDKALSIDAAGRPGLYIYDGAANQLTWGTAIPLGRWTHLAGTGDGTTMRLYVDGRLVTSKAGGNSFTGYSVSNLYCNGTGGTGAWVRMDARRQHVAAFAGAVPAERIRAHYLAGAAELAGTGLRGRLR